MIQYWQQFLWSLSLVIISISCATQVTERGSYSKKANEINKIVIIPLLLTPRVPGEIPPGKDRFITVSIYDDLTEKVKGVAVVSVISSIEGFNRLKDENPSSMYEELAIQVGRYFNADAVLTGNISAYRERVGGELGTSSPASVAFGVQLIDPSDGGRLWEAYFVETQETLLENVSKIGKFFERKGKWITADQLAREGVGDITDRLIIFLGKN